MKFSGAVGYGIATEISPGVWDDEIIEREYYGEVVRNTRQLSESEYLNDNIRVNNSISVVADAYMSEHFFAIRYVRWAGTLWSVREVEVKGPRLIMRLGGVWNGRTP